MDRGPLLRKLKLSHPLSASGMRSIVSRLSLGYLAPVQDPSSKHQFRTVTGKGAGPVSNPQCPAAVPQENNNINSGSKVAITASVERRGEGLPGSASMLS